MKSVEYLRLEYPRPQFRRDDWQALNGEWEFEFDDKADGEKRKLTSGKVALGKKINVPFTYQYKASGIGDTSVHETVWYRRTFAVDKKNINKRALLCFNAVDYEADVWINGLFAVHHEGGFTPFSKDITNLLTKGENVIVVRCIDKNDPTQPRGKQSWTGERFGCWYYANTGIWQSVWLEFFGNDAIESYTLLPDIDKCAFGGEIATLYGTADELEITVSYKDKVIKKQRVSTDGKYTRYNVSMMELDFVDEHHYWTPQSPNLFYVDFALYKNGKQIDLAHTRFGMRKISIDDSGKICLNNKPVYQRLILDQGYWKEGGLTPVSAEAIKRDIELAIKMGFNGARKHQKFEDPYFYYYAEELGFLSWVEMPSAYNFNNNEVIMQSSEWANIVKIAMNFTSVVTYVPLNESWGVRKIRLDINQQNYARAMYFLTKSLDNTRLISTNDGWENPDDTDITSVHDYSMDSSYFGKKYNSETFDSVYMGDDFRKIIADNSEYYGQPAILTEFGGIALVNDAKDGNWGYGKGAENGDDLLARLTTLMDGVYDTEFQGFCYTQLTDVQQEVNGLLDADHNAKVDVEELAKIFNRK